MKARCNICGKEVRLESIGYGVYKTSKEMEEHQKEHSETIVWELIPDIKDTVITFDEGVEGYDGKTVTKEEEEVRV
ncbi:MAG: hypothetical protein N2V75_00190 [Methanophagales archaeon]|nr:hypothetical protein [Methanophagales archaeon]